jgi:hypothetical protein
LSAEVKAMLTKQGFTLTNYPSLRSWR